MYTQFLWSRSLLIQRDDCQIKALTLASDTVNMMHKEKEEPEYRGGWKSLFHKWVSKFGYEIQSLSLKYILQILYCIFRIILFISFI